MNEKQWYEALFENYGQKYDSENFVGGTKGECDFIEEELKGDKSLRILDVGCGTGRHSIEMAARGFSVVGIDLSDSLLDKARSKAAQSTLTVNFYKHDARNLPFINEFDCAVMLCEGGFPLMETDEMNFEILRNVARSIKPGAKFIFTTLNGLFPLYHSVDSFLSAGNKEGNVQYQSDRFDLMTFRDHKTLEVEDDSGRKKILKSSERYYVPSEISWMLKSLGYTNIEIFGCKLGAFSRNDKLTTTDYEMLVLANRK